MTVRAIGHGSTTLKAYSHPSVASEARTCTGPQNCQDLAANLDLHGAFSLCEQKLLDAVCKHLHRVQGCEFPGSLLV
jgi:hypothetical protein